MEEVARRDYDVAIARRLMADDGTAPWLTFPKAIEEVGDLLAVANASEHASLTELRDFLSQRAEEAAALIV